MMSLNQIMRLARKFLGSSSPSDEPIFARVNSLYGQSAYLVRAYYLVSTFLAYEILVDMHVAAGQPEVWDYLWPVRWMDWIGAGVWAPEKLTLALLIASAAAIQFHGQILIRIAVAVLALMVAALTNSQGGINHGFHVWVWIGICFVFLPSMGRSRTPREFRMSYLTVMASAQALIMLFYTLAGLWKVRYGLVELISGQEGNFSPRGLALQLADRVLVTGTKPLLADLAISNYWLIWPMFLGIIYCQATAIFAAFRPRLHLIWGYGLVSFHVGTWLLMEISFPIQMLFVGLLFVMSPFQPGRFDLRATMADLPIFGVLFRTNWLARKQEAVARQPA